MLHSGKGGEGRGGEGRGGEGNGGEGAKGGGMSSKESMGRCTEKEGEGGGERQWDTQQEGMGGDKREDGTELNVIRHFIVRILSIRVPKSDVTTTPYMDLM